MDAEKSQNPFSPAFALWLNRLMFVVIPLIWTPFIVLAVVRGKFVFSRSGPLIVIAALGIAYLVAFRRSSISHPILGILANVAVVVGASVTLVTMGATESLWGAIAVGVSVLFLFGYPLVVLINAARHRVKQ